MSSVKVAGAILEKIRRDDLWPKVSRIKRRSSSLAGFMASPIKPSKCTSSSTRDRSVSDRITAYALYIDPPLGRAGMTEAEVRKSGRKALLGKRPMTRVARAVEKGETQGFMKILVDAESKEILGASLLGTECDEVIHSILDVMYAKAPYTVIQRAMHIHPTVTELIPTMFGEIKPLE